VNTPVVQDLPHDRESERAVLGAAMLSAESAGRVVEALTARHFHDPMHQVGFECIVDLVSKSAPVSPVSVKAEMDRRVRTGEQVHPRVLVDLMESIAVAGHIGYYLDRVKEFHYRQGLVLGGLQLTSLGRRIDLDVEDVAGRAHAIVDQATGVARDSSGRSLAELMPEYLSRLELKADDRGVTTGLVDLDHLLNKLRPGQLVVIGARPGMGKSVLMSNMALHVGVGYGLPVLFASLEMSEDEIQARMLAHHAKVALSAIQRREFSTHDWIRIHKAGAELASAEHLIIDDDPGISIAHLRDRLSAMRRHGHPAAVVFVDYLQLMTSPKRTESRQQEVSDLSRSLKLLAKDLDVPVVVGAQLNRGPEQRANKRPTKADLRESGSVEQDADVVILLHREDVYEPESPRAGEIDLIVDKNRQGPTATITAAFQGHYSRIADMAPEPSQQWNSTRGMS
jgi:replicative DNA helicase